MARSFKTEAVVLRSIRYAEADRVLHIYTPAHGRLGAMAKGVRRTRSRMGGRLEPLSRVALVLHRGRSDLATITSVDTVNGHPAIRESRAALDCAVSACESLLRLFDTGEPNEAAYNLLCNELALLNSDPGRASRAHALAFRAKLALAAGFAPELSACATCGETDDLAGFSPAAGGVVCASCEAGAFALDQEAHRFLTGVLSKPLTQVPEAGDRALGQADRALAETLEHHAHVRLRRVA